LEVKGGGISVKDGTWFTTPYGGTEIALSKSPFTQVADARYELARYLAERCSIPRGAFSHGVVLPDCVVKGALGPDAPRELIIDERDLLRPIEAVQRISEKWNVDVRLDAAKIEAIIKTLKPSLNATIVLAARVVRTEEGIARETRRQVELVEGQIESYEELLRSNRAVVVGGAGTGKTILAVERARRLVDTGAKTLLLCHRRTVFSFMATLLNLAGEERAYDPLQPRKLHLAHYTGLLRGLENARGETASPSKSPNLSEWMLERGNRLGLKYDALVIDEGQEFVPDQFEALSWLLDDPEISPMYVFADPFQHSGLYSATGGISRREMAGRYQWKAPIEGSFLRLTHNCRNSREISEFAGRFYPLNSPIATVGGTPPDFIVASTVKDVIGRSVKTAQALVTRHQMKSNQVLVILIGIDPSEFHSAARQAHLHTVEVDGLFRFPLTPIDVRIPVGRADDVQGLEAEAVVVAHWQQGPISIDSVRDVYVAATRGRSLLHIVSNVDRHRLEASAQAALDAEQHAGRKSGTKAIESIGERHQVKGDS
jgi:hypothetical protein